jgi:glucokinase
MNGTIYAGASMASGEFGQMVIADDGGDLRHDRPGCLEMLVSDQAVCDRFAQQQGKKSSRAADSAARVRRICRLAMEGDRDAEEAVRQTVRYLALGVANMAFALDPEVIILNTTLNPAWPLLMEGIRAQLPDKAQWPAFQKLSILPSVLGEEGALIGAATLPFAPLFESVSTGMALLPEQLQA